MPRPTISRTCSRPSLRWPVSSPRALDAYAKEHGYSIVLDGGNQQLPVVIYANPTFDISKAVVEAYNLKSGIPAPEKRQRPPHPLPPRAARSQGARRPLGRQSTLSTGGHAQVRGLLVVQGRL